MSVGEQNFRNDHWGAISLFGNPAHHVEIWDAMPLGKSDDECKESGTE
jgi:hypothetical protein